MSGAAKGAWVAFDLDGTILTCEQRQSAVLRAALRRAGHPIDPAAVWMRKRAGASTHSALLGEGLGNTAADEVCVRWLGMIEQPVWLSLDRPFSGVHDALEALATAGHRLALLTARRLPQLVSAQLHALRLRHFFDELIVVPPDGASMAKADHLRRLRPEGFFGDTESDARAAAAAGSPMFAVACGQRSLDFLRRSGVPAIYADLPDAVCAWLALVSRSSCRE